LGTTYVKTAGLAVIQDITATGSVNCRLRIGIPAYSYLLGAASSATAGAKNGHSREQDKYTEKLTHIGFTPVREVYQKKRFTPNKNNTSLVYGNTTLSEGRHEEAPWIGNDP
jgi:hypothetical protein